MTKQLYQLKQVEIKFNNDRNLTYSCAYTPKSEGNHRVFVSLLMHFNRKVSVV